jgi:hypothetical protein
MNNWTIVSIGTFVSALGHLLGPSGDRKALPAIPKDKVVANVERGMASVSLSV